MGFVSKSMIDFVRLKFEMLAALIVYVLLICLMPIGIWITVYILFFTNYWLIAVTYLFWIWIVDRDTPEGVGRISNWVRSWALFKYAANYFPVSVHLDPTITIDPKRNYLACSFPHGVMPTGAILAFQTNVCGTKVIAPHHTIHGITLRGLFYIPIYRDFMLSLGVCSANAKSIERILLHPGGGKIVGLVAGGSAEMFHSHSGEYQVILKNRKGFVKLALKTGAPLIPVFSFGETNVYKQKVFSKGSPVRRFQEWLKDAIGFPIVLSYGRGLFQDAFGLIPLKTPINVVVGKPIEVSKIQDPTQEDIDGLHKRFLDNLNELFETHKYSFEPYPDKSRLIIN